MKRAIHVLLVLISIGLLFSSCSKDEEKAVAYCLLKTYNRQVQADSSSITADSIAFIYNGNKVVDIRSKFGSYAIEFSADSSIGKLYEYCFNSGRYCKIHTLSYANGRLVIDSMAGANYSDTLHYAGNNIINVKSHYAETRFSYDANGNNVTDSVFQLTDSSRVLISTVVRTFDDKNQPFPEDLKWFYGIYSNNNVLTSISTDLQYGTTISTTSTYNYNAEDYPAQMSSETVYSVDGHTEHYNTTFTYACQ